MPRLRKSFSLHSTPRGASSSFTIGGTMHATTTAANANANNNNNNNSNSSPSTSTVRLLKRKRSHSLDSATMESISNKRQRPQLESVLPTPDFSSLADTAPQDPEENDDAYSCAPTEIVEDVHVPGPYEKLVAACKEQGVKVRDFCYDDPLGLKHAKVVWDHNRAMDTLTKHDQYIRAPDRLAMKYRPSDKELYCLRTIGWVTDAEAQRHWRPGDTTAVEQYVKRYGHYDFALAGYVKKPTWATRIARRSRYFAQLPDGVPEEKIYKPPDEPGMYDAPRGEGVLPTVPWNIHLEADRAAGGTFTGLPQCTPPASPTVAAVEDEDRATTPPIEEPPAPRSRALVRTTTIPLIQL